MGTEELQKKESTSAIHTKMQKEVTQAQTFVRPPASMKETEKTGTDKAADKTEEKPVINIPVEAVPKEAIKKPEKHVRSIVYKPQEEKQLTRMERFVKYTDAEKNRRMKLLSEKNIPIPKDREELVLLRRKHMEFVNLTDEKGNFLMTTVMKDGIPTETIRQDNDWKMGTDDLIKENYEWLMEYFISRDDSFDTDRDITKAVPEIKFTNHESEVRIDGMEDAYERQEGLNCYCCTGAAMINQFIAKKTGGVVKRIADQEKMRAFVPNALLFDPATEGIFDKDSYEGALRGIDDFAGEDRYGTGNLFHIGDYIFDTLKDNGIEDAMLNKVVLRVPPLNRKKGDNKRAISKFNNMKAVFADKISEVTNSGSVVGALVVENGFSHYMTITAIKGTSLTVYDSSLYGGKPKTLDIESFVKRGSTVELNWISDQKKPEQLTKEYKNLGYDKQNGYYVKNQNIQILSESQTHTRGVTIMKGEDELGEAYEGIAMYSYIPEPKKEMDTAPLRDVLFTLDREKALQSKKKDLDDIPYEEEKQREEEQEEEKKEEDTGQEEEEKQEEKEEEKKEEDTKQEEEEKQEEKEDEKKEEHTEQEEKSSEEKKEESEKEESEGEEEEEQEQEKEERKHSPIDEKPYKKSGDKIKANMKKLDLAERNQAFSDLQKRRQDREKEEKRLEKAIQKLSEKLESFEGKGLSEEEVSEIKKTLRNDIKGKQKKLEKLRKDNPKENLKDKLNYEKGLVRDKEGRLVKKYNADYDTYGLGVSLGNTKIENTDSREMAQIKAALVNYQNIRKDLFTHYGLREISAEEYMKNNRRFTGIQFQEGKDTAKLGHKLIVDTGTEDEHFAKAGQRFYQKFLKTEDREVWGKAYEALRQAVRDYELTHLRMFKYGRGKARFNQVLRLKEKIEMDNMRFDLSWSRRNIRDSLDYKYQNEHMTVRKSFMPTWGHYLLFRDRINIRNQAHRDKRRRQKEEGTLPAWYKRAWSWTKDATKNSLWRVVTGYEAAGGLIDRTLGLATAAVANTVNLAGKVVKTPLKLASCMFNGVSKYVGSKKRWRVNNDPRKGWAGIDEGRRIFRRYLKGVTIIPYSLIEPIWRGVPRLWGHKYKHGVFKLTSRWTKDIWQDIKEVGYDLGFKNYDAINERSEEDVRMAGYAEADRFIEGNADMYRGEAVTNEEAAAREDKEYERERRRKRKALTAPIKVNGFNASSLPVIGDIQRRLTPDNTEGDKLLNALNADRLETVKALTERFGADKMEPVKDTLSYNIMYGGMNDAKDLKWLESHLTEDWGRLKLLSKEKVLDIRFQDFCYQNEEEFKANFVRNYKRLQYFDQLYEAYFGKDKDPSFIENALPDGRYGAEVYERLKLVRRIKEDYDRRISMLQGQELPKQKKPVFRMGMNSRDLEESLRKNIEKSAKADAKRQGKMAEDIFLEYSNYCRKNRQKYEDGIDEEGAFPPESLVDFIKLKAESLPVPEFTDDELSKELLDMPYNPGFNLRGSDIANQQRMVVAFKNGKEFGKLPARLRRAYLGELEKYRKRRREYEKKKNFEKIYNEYAMFSDGKVNFEAGREGIEFSRNPYYTEEDKTNIQNLVLSVRQIDKDIILSNGNPEEPDGAEKFYRDAHEFTVFRMKHGICFTKDDPRWKELEKFEKDYVVQEELYVTVHITYSGKTHDVRTIRAFDEKDLNLNIEAKSEEELNTIKEELAELEKIAKKGHAYYTFRRKHFGGKEEISDVMASEYAAQQDLLNEKTRAICGYFLKKDDKEAKKAYIEGKLEALEEEGDYKKAGDFLLKCFINAADGAAGEDEYALGYLKNLGQVIKDLKEEGTAEKEYAGRLFEYLKSKGDQPMQDASKGSAQKAGEEQGGEARTRALEAMEMYIPAL